MESVTSDLWFMGAIVLLLELVYASRSAWPYWSVDRKKHTRAVLTSAEDEKMKLRRCKEAV